MWGTGNQPNYTRDMVWSLLTVLVLVATLTMEHASIVADGAGNTTMPGCPHMCGNVSVPYPFGFWEGCYRPGFNLTCDENQVPYLGNNNNTVVLKINLLQGEVLVRNPSPVTIPTSFEVGSGAFTIDHAPLVVHWWISRNGTYVLDRNLSSYACIAKYSTSINTPMGYLCNCSQGFTGNPYLLDGCQDINECVDPSNYPCLGVCYNTFGGYTCSCPPGTHGSNPKYEPCKYASTATGVSIGIGLVSAALLLLLVALAIFVSQKAKRRRAMNLKQKYFEQNRGQLLQQLVSQRTDIAERMIITVDELAKATHNFDSARKLGSGGHGTVYKGILSDLHVVAIKKSNIAVQREIDEFINEVAILSQINHRNVVKILGCCLETEVPMLVYEFISNGTLYHHLHVESPISLSWRNRLRIAVETASAIAYLHSSVSTPIIHRDIKSSNILLDDTLTSKVSDFGASRYIPQDRTALTTAVQGTIGYLDPMYFYAGRLTDKSDVYSFGVILVELLTRKKPFSYLSPNGEGLVAHFSDLHGEDSVAQILDPQVVEEGGREVQAVAALASSCVRLRSEERPTMRQVTLALEGILSAENHAVANNMLAEEFEDNGQMLMDYPSPDEGQSMGESTRWYSLEQESLMAVRSR